MNTLNYYTYKSGAIYGDFTIVCENVGGTEVLVALRFGQAVPDAAETPDKSSKQVSQGAHITRELTALTAQMAEQLDEYFSGRRQVFDISLRLAGSTFMTDVLKALMQIPYGETRSYKQIAEAVGNLRATRAVGMICNKNPIAIIIPCHRVIGSNGSLTGYAGGLKLKRKLLEHEHEGTQGTSCCASRGFSCPCYE